MKHKYNIVYTETDRQDLDLVAALWEKLNELHKALSPHFPAHYDGMTWLKRKRDLLEKSENGRLRVDLARDAAVGKNVGYCISTISAKGQGEIDSIYIEEDYRHCGIGDNLTQKALSWMDTHSVDGIMVEVASGNEEVFLFYNRHDFYPRSVILRRKNP